MNNNFRIYPEMAVHDINRVALELGCEVIIGNRQGEIILKHPEINSSLLLSADEKMQGAKFTDWAGILISNHKERFAMLNLQSKQGRVAGSLHRMSYPDKTITLDELMTDFEGVYTRKQVADWMSHLVRRGYVERVAPGRYRTTQILSQAAEAYSQDQVKDDNFKPPRGSSRTADLSETAKPGKKKTGQGSIEAPGLEELISRLENAVERLEKTARGFQVNTELVEAMTMMHKALEKAGKFR